MTNSRTCELLMGHYERFPDLQAEDIFKFLFQSAFGCEHLVSDRKNVSEYIKQEYNAISENAAPFKEELDGDYSRVYLSWLNSGLSVRTLAEIFCLSAKKEVDGEEHLQQKIQYARELIASGRIPLDRDEFENKLADWKAVGCPAVRHSEVFRSTYKPAYRVIADKYADFLPVFAEIDKLLSKGKGILAIEGGSASGKSTLSEALAQVYDCNVFHADDFFLRPEQRTPDRLNEVGGNFDRERFYEEVVRALVNNETVCCRPFDCSSQTLGEVITVFPKRLTVVEGVYSMHPFFGKYYDLAVFLDVDPVFQQKRIEKRNSPFLAKRFFEEWIPLENIYFKETDIKNRVDFTISIKDKCGL